MWKRGFHVYWPTFIQPLLDSTDMPALKATYPPNDSGFTNARIALEPYAFGSSPTTGTCDLGAQLSPGPNPEEAMGNYVNLVHDIHLLEECGFSVILDCHPIFLTATHYGHEIVGFPNAPATWPGPFRKTLVTAPGGVVTSAHPLANFWRSFLTNLNSVWSGEYPLEVLPKNVAFEVMNEPLANFDTLNDDWNSNVDGPHGNYLNRCNRDWRNIQLQAVKAIWEDVPGMTQHRIIVTPGSYLARKIRESYINITDWDGVTTIPEWHFTAYSQGEYSPVGNELARYNLIYTLHQYSPYKYTHGHSSGGWVGNPLFSPPPYINNGTGPTTSDYAEDPAHLARYSQSLPVNEPGDNVLNGLNPMQQWRIDNHMPPMIVGEFGVQVKSEAEEWGGTSNGSVDPNEFVWRGQWIFDNRVDMENYGIGWAYFDYCSQIGCFTGKFLNSATGVRENRGGIESNAQLGLFGTVRPQ